MQALVLDCLPPSRRALFEDTQLGHFLVMAFAGYIVYHHVEPRRPLDERTLDALCRTFLGRRAGPEEAVPSVRRSASKSSVLRKGAAPATKR